MNSVEGYKGFITFIILSGIVLTALIGFNYIAKPTSTQTKASQTKVTPLNIEVQNTTDVSTTITWITKDETSSMIKYSLNPDVCTTSEESICTEVSNSTVGTSHKVVLSHLTPNTVYYYKIKAGDDYYPSSSPLNFQTRPIKSLINDNEPEPSPPTDNDSDYEGIIPTVIEPSTSTQEVLGKQTDIVSELTIKEFKGALKHNDLNYDFNNDGEVTNLDYPLFIEFITNKED